MGEVQVSDAQPVVNAMTVDVEDYFQVSAFERHIARADWERLECRIERNVDRILALFAAHDVHATFFMLGWVAERYPAMVRRIVDAGHELASHGYQHVRVTQQGPEEFRADVARTKALLEDLGGARSTATAPPAIPSAHAICGRWTCSANADTATARASTRSATTSTACRRRRASRFATAATAASSRCP
jgi:peptidoglycan/xylan/chitin deacetylase (PgdA/CDA1 family)